MSPFAPKSDSPSEPQINADSDSYTYTDSDSDSYASLISTSDSAPTTSEPTVDEATFNDASFDRECRQTRLDGLKIVVVEDSTDARKLLGRFLEAAGANVYMAASAPEARDLLRHFQPDLLISDIGMPDEDGIAFVRDLRLSERETGKHLPAIALTAFLGLEHRELTARAGFEEHLLKPVAAETLVSAIRRVLASREPSLH